MKKTLLLSCLILFPFFYSLSQTTVNIPAQLDNTLYEDASGNLSNGAGDHFFVGTTGSNRIRRALVLFDVAASIPAGATIVSATLTLSMDMSVSGPNMISLYPLTAGWGEGTSVAGGGGGGGGASTSGDATWIHTFYPGSTWATAGGDHAAGASAATSVNGTGLYSWTSSQVQADVQSWLDAAATNFGWELIGNEATASTAKRFASRENASAPDQPSLSVTYTLPCIDPSVITFSASSTSICSGSSVTLTVDGNLNSATSWQLYSGSCGGTAIASNTTGIFTVSPSVTTDYFVRGEGGCVTAGSCDQLAITVPPTDDPSFSYTASAYCADDADPSATITGTTGGTFAALPSGLSINGSDGSIDLSASTAGSYTITYTTSGTCAAGTTQQVSINPVYSMTDAQSICSGSSYSFGTQTLSATGIYTEIFPSLAGCDSTVTLTLSVITVDTSITVLSNELLANSATGTFQWFDCDANAPISGATDSSYFATGDGHYSLIVTDNGCVDTSGCVHVIVLCTCSIAGSTCPLHNNLSSWPNPVTDNLKVDLGKIVARATAEITDSRGILVKSLVIENKQLVEMDLKDFRPGIYFMKINAAGKTSFVKIVRQ